MSRYIAHLVLGLGYEGEGDVPALVLSEVCACEVKHGTLVARLEYYVRTHAQVRPQVLAHELPRYDSLRWPELCENFSIKVHQPAECPAPRTPCFAALDGSGVGSSGPASGRCFRVHVHSAMPRDVPGDNVCIVVFLHQRMREDVTCRPAAKRRGEWAATQYMQGVRKHKPRTPSQTTSRTAWHTDRWPAHRRGAYLAATP